MEHSTGSGKTNSIAWLAHRLTSLHDAENRIIFDNVIIDEAHSSTSGRDMAAVTRALGSGEQEPEDVEDAITEEIYKSLREG